MNESTKNELNTKSILGGGKMIVWPFNGSKNSWSECLNVNEYSHAEFYSVVKLASPDLHGRHKATILVFSGSKHGYAESLMAAVLAILQT